jgi:drug/metabolite transporter (DMT)-like permease
LYIVTRIALETVPPITLLFFRYTIASVALFSLARIEKKCMRVKPEDWKYFIFIGVVGYFVSVGAQIFGTKYAGASVASLINATNPIFITLFAVLILKERLTRSKLVATITTFIGAYVILGGARTVGTVWGIAFSMVSVIFWSLTSVSVRRISRTYDPIVLTTYAISIAVICALPASGLELYATQHGDLFSIKNILCIFYLGLICTAVPNILWNKSLSLVEASTCSLFYPIQPLVSVFLGVTILGEKVDLKTGAGAVLIIGGILYAMRSERNR